MAWFLWLLVGLAISVVSYLLMPQPKAQKPPATSDLESPTAEAGRPVSVIFGTITVKGGNILWYGEKSHQNREVKA